MYCLILCIFGIMLAKLCAACGLYIQNRPILYIAINLLAIIAFSTLLDYLRKIINV
jgi:hypothetical protein